MSETHIAHAIASFSELGIAAGVVWLVDVIDLREELAAQLLVAKESRRVTQASYTIKAKGFDATLSFLIRSFLYCRETCFSGLVAFLLGLLHWSPLVCIALGIYALVGISFYPTAPDFLPSCCSFDQGTLDTVYFIMSVLSFMVVCTPIVSTTAKKVINWYALRDIKIE